jgi:BASS family bile acid:Na+ symporter
MLQLLRNRNVILIMGLVVGLILPQGARYTYRLTLPTLMIVMIVATMSVPGHLFRSPRELWKPALFGILMNYGVLGSLILGMGAILVREESLWRGLVILATVPPAVAVIPFTNLLKGNSTFSLLGTIGAHLAAFLIMPVIAWLLLGSLLLSPTRLVMIMVVLIFVPLAVSRILVWRHLDRKLEPFKGTITNWGFFVVFYTIVALNQDIFVRQTWSLLPVVCIAVSTTFLLGWVIERWGRCLKIDVETRTSLILLGTLKNYGLAGVISLALFGKSTALPASVSAAFMIVYIGWLGFRVK